MFFLSILVYCSSWFGIWFWFFCRKELYRLFFFSGIRKCWMSFLKFVGYFGKLKMYLLLLIRILLLIWNFWSWRLCLLFFWWYIESICGRIWCRLMKMWLKLWNLWLVWLKLLWMFLSLKFFIKCWMIMWKVRFLLLKKKMYENIFD